MRKTRHIFLVFLSLCSFYNYLSLSITCQFLAFFLSLPIISRYYSHMVKARLTHSFAPFPLFRLFHHVAGAPNRNLSLPILHWRKLSSNSQRAWEMGCSIWEYAKLSKLPSVDMWNKTARWRQSFSVVKNWPLNKLKTSIGKWCWRRKVTHWTTISVYSAMAFNTSIWTDSQAPNQISMTRKPTTAVKWVIKKYVHVHDSEIHCIFHIVSILTCYYYQFLFCTRLWRAFSRPTYMSAACWRHLGGTWKMVI